MNLLQGLRAWLAEGPPAASPNAAGRAAFDLDAVFAERRTAKALVRAAAFLPDIEESLVGRIVRSFLATVADLPASESHHHAETFGLFQHSLETAEYALRAAQSEHFVASTEAYPEEQEFRLPRLRFAAWFFALFHDVGKIAQVLVHGPCGTTWNAYEEPLESYYARHGRPGCVLAWKVGRGLNGHTRHSAYLLGRHVTSEVAALLGPRLAAELFENESPAAQEVQRLVAEADHRSTGEAVARLSKIRSDDLYVQALSDDFTIELPRIFAHGLARGDYRVNGPGADVFIGGRTVLLRYPHVLVKLAGRVRDEMGHEWAEARTLSATEEGARGLATALHRRRRLFADAETGSWKLTAKIAGGDAADVTSAVLIPRAFLDSALAAAGTWPLFGHEILFSRPGDGIAVAVGDFKGSPTVAPAATLIEVPKAVAPVPPRAPAADPLPPRLAAAPSLPVPPAPPLKEVPASPASHAPAPPMLKRHSIDGPTLAEDLRACILADVIATNVPNGQVYVLENWTYVITPIIFQKLVDRGLYDVNPSADVNAYLNPLSKLPIVRKGPAGRIILSVQLRPNTRPLRVVAFDTEGFFHDRSAVLKVGYWAKTIITELSDAEHARIVSELDAARKMPARPPAAGGAAHAA